MPLGSDFIALEYLEYTLSCDQINFIIKTYEGQMAVAQIFNPSSQEAEAGRSL